MKLPTITVVVGIDKATIEQLKVSWPTWRKNRPMMWDWPWIIFYDRDQLTYAEAAAMRAEMALSSEDDQIVMDWPPPGEYVYGNQRERMLTGHVFTPATFVTTEYYFKLDTDAVAHRHDKPIDPAWFAERPDVVAPRWGYTKGHNFLGQLEDWGDKAFPDMPRLNIPFDPEHKRVGHPRWCSWCSFYSCEFAKVAAESCTRTFGKFRLPVPSQDTTMWYIAERLGRKVVKPNMKAHGWNNHSRYEDLKRIAAEIMGQP